MDELDPTFKPEFQKPDAADEIFFHARKIQGLEEEVLHPKRTTDPCEHLEMNGQVPLQSETELHGQRKVGSMIGGDKDDLLSPRLGWGGAEYSSSCKDESHHQLIQTQYLALLGYCRGQLRD